MHSEPHVQCISLTIASPLPERHRRRRAEGCRGRVTVELRFFQASTDELRKMPTRCHPHNQRRTIPSNRYRQILADPRRPVPLRNEPTRARANLSPSVYIFIVSVQRLFLVFFPSLHRATKTPIV